MFHRMLCCGSQKWRWLILWTSVNPRDQFMEKDFPNFEMLGCEDCFCSEQDHPEFPVQEEGQFRGTEKPRKRTCFYGEDRFWTGAPDTVFEYADVFLVFLHDVNLWEFDTRLDEVLSTTTVKDSLR